MAYLLLRVACRGEHSIQVLRSMRRQESDGCHEVRAVCEQSLPLYQAGVDLDKNR